MFICTDETFFGTFVLWCWVVSVLKLFYALHVRTSLGDFLAIGKPQLTLLTTEVRDKTKEITGVDVEMGENFTG